MSASPTVAIRTAIGTALQASTFLAGRKMYMAGSVPRTIIVSGSSVPTPFPYIVADVGTETGLGADRYNQQYGHANTQGFNCWGKDKHQAELCYEELKARVDNVPLTVVGHGISRGRIEKITDFPEPNAEVTGHVVIARYRIITQVAA